MEAIPLLRQMLTKHPGNEKLMYNLAWALSGTIRESRENYEEAVLLYHKILEISTDTEMRNKVSRDLMYRYYTLGNIEKALYSYTGVYPTLVQAFADQFGDGCQWINREDDAADRGLRTSKLQYGPAMLGSKFCFEPKNELMEYVREIPQLKTERLTLSALTEEDIPAYNALVLDGERNRWWGYDDVGGLGGPVEERSFYEVAQADFASKLAVNFAVRLDGKLIGEAVLYHFDCRGSAELGCRIDAAYAGNGYGTEAFTAVANWGLYKIQLSRIVAKCFKENEASYKMLSSCMRKCGDDETFFYFEKLV
jgi:RimJ/RimL family protein N-acetyltransferase